MSAVIISLLEITVFSVILYAAILLIKRIFRGTLSPTLQYAVWGLLILRLVVPITINSGPHLIVLPSSSITVSGRAENTLSSSGYITVSSRVNANTKPDAVAAAPSADAGRPIPAAVPQIRWQAVLLLIWAAGALVSAACRAVIWRRLNRSIDRTGRPVPAYLTDIVEKCKNEMGIHARIDIALQSFLPSPALTTAVKPKLLLPENTPNLMDDWQLEVGIRHELTHYRRRDYLANLLLMILRCVYWFNPVVWAAFPQIEADMEAACDASVTDGMEGKEKTRYAQTLIDFGCRTDLHYMLEMGAHPGRKAMEKRIRSIFMSKKTGYRVRLGMLLLTLLLLVSCFTTACRPVQGAAAFSQSQGSSSDTVSDGSAVGNTLESAVGSAILGRLAGSPFGEAKTQGHVILGTSADKSGDTLVYAVASYAEFGFENNVFTIVSGSGAIPAVIRLSENGALISYTELDGDTNQSSAQSIFPEPYRKDAQNAGQYLPQLQKQQEDQAAAYLKSIGRNSQIQLSGVIKKSFGISAKASNTLIAMPDLSDYPSWIGTREELADGTRTIYETGEQDFSGYALITYTKKTAGGNILQQMQFQITGDQVVWQAVSGSASSASAGNTITGIVTDGTMSTITIKAADGAEYSFDKDGATVKSDHGILLGDTVEIVYSGDLKKFAKALIITVKSSARS